MCACVCIYVLGILFSLSNVLSKKKVGMWCVGYYVQQEADKGDVIYIDGRYMCKGIGGREGEW